MTGTQSQGLVPAGRLSEGHGVSRLDDLQVAQVEMRNAIQWLARVARSYSAAPDDRIRLHLDADARSLHTPELARGTRLGLHLPSLVFQFYEQGVGTPHALDVDERSSTEIEAWLLAELLHRGLDQRLLRKDLPYAFDGQMSGDEAKYSPHRLFDRLDRLSQEIVQTAGDLRLARRIMTDGAGASNDLLFWPDRCTVGFTLPRDDGHVVVAHETVDGGAGRYRVSKCRLGTSADILVSKTPHAESVAREIVGAIRSLEGT